MTEILEVGAERAADVLAVIHGAFAGRPVLDPPSTALEETEESVASALAEGGGLLAVHEGEPVGALLFASGELLGLRRVGVLVEARKHGVASLLAERAEAVARERGCAGLVLEARSELPRTVQFWQRHGYTEVDRSGSRLHLQRLLPTRLTLPTPEETRAVGVRLGALVRGGDLLILTGDLGAGKTTFTQGLGEGLGVRGSVTSPTFVISRVHPSTTGGPALIHVDAYRLGAAAELDDLDLDTDVDEAVTVVEWGSGLAEVLSADRLEITLHRAADDVRTMTITPVGARWTGVDLGLAK